MNYERMTAATQFVRETFGPGADLEVDDDGEAYITVGDQVTEGFLSFNNRDRVQHLTIVP